MAKAPDAKPITAVLIDDHPLFRMGLRELLEARGIDVVGDVPTAEAGLVLVERHAPDVAVIDLGLPGMSGIEAIRWLAANAPRTRILVLTVSASEADVVEAVLVGGSCYLLKDTPVETIVAGVRAAAAGEAMISPKMAATLLERLRANGVPEGSAATAQLSDREKQVLRLVASGRENDEIARELFISSHTVKNHISSILLKLHVANRIQAAVRAVREAMI
ncbi:MAG: response regulator transcription factor [Conexibacter sp.]